MAYTAIHPRKWGKGDTITVGGVSYLVTKKPTRTKEGEWEITTATVSGKILVQYINEEQVEGLRS